MPYQLPNGGELVLDYAAVGALLRSAGMRSLMTEMAHRVAAIAVGGEGVERVWVDSYTTDRSAAAVTIAVKGGEDGELKYGILANAATAAGLEYSQKGGGEA